MTCSPEFVLEVRGLAKTYTQGKFWQRKFRRHALDNVSIVLQRGTTLSVIGESGSGKTTLAMCLVGLEHPDAGDILLNGISLHSLKKKARILEQRKIQLVFQDSAGALNPRLTALQIIEEPLLIKGGYDPRERSSLAEEMMELVGISRAWKHRSPHEFSGGQRQRLAIARALILKPEVLILDEVFVGLDLSIRGQIANLLLDIQQRRGLSYLCISHDVALMAQFADAFAVMDQGRIAETGGAAELLKRVPNSLIIHAPSQSLALSAHSGA
jgi:peptide/nickel transport system ATP-binding protein